MISAETIQKIYDHIDIYDIVSDFITLRKRGINYTGLCPFHNEKTPSLSVSPAKGIFKCFGCGKAGNAVNFIMEHEQFTYYEALRFLAKKYHVEIKETELNYEQKQLKNTRESLLIVLDYANKYFQQLLHQTDFGKNIVLSYMQERKFNLAVIQKFDLGFNTEKNNAFSNSALKNGYKEEYLIQAGLSIKRENKLIDRFKGRIIFPIHSIAGKVVGFGGRVLNNNSKVVKYINSPESAVYNKSRLLYGLYFAKESIRKNDNCYLVEGYTDVLSLHQAGIENVVASSGTSLTQNQILQLKRLTNNITLIFDGDKAGVKASFRNIDLMLENDINLSVIPLPNSEDPDSFSKNLNSSELKTYLTEKSQDFILYKTSFVYKDILNDPVKKSNVIMDIIPSISSVSNMLTRDEYIKKCSHIMEIDEKVLHAEIVRYLSAKQKQKNKNSLHNVQPWIPKSVNPCDKIEKELIRYLLIYGDKPLTGKDDEKTVLNVATYILEELEKNKMTSEDELHQLIYEEYKEEYRKKGFNAIRYFTQHSNSKVTNLIANILSESYPINNKWNKHISVEDTNSKVLHSISQFLNAYKQKKIQLIQNSLQKKIIEAKERNDKKLIKELMKEKIWLDETKSKIAKMLGNRTLI